MHCPPTNCKEPVHATFCSPANPPQCYPRNSAASPSQERASVWVGDDTEDSDLDLLVDPTLETTLFDIAKNQVELKELLGVAVEWMC